MSLSAAGRRKAGRNSYSLKKKEKFLDQMSNCQIYKKNVKLNKSNVL
jgi:hypothetical protein